MKVLLIGGAVAAAIIVGILAVAHVTKLCRTATIFLEHH